MENASKALIMAAGILLGILILALMTTLFLSSRELSTSYDERKQSEAVQQFNVNFTKYLGQDLTIHDVVTICNFANENKVDITNKTNTNKNDNPSTYIPSELSKKSEYHEQGKDYYYTINISAYGEDGKVSKVSFQSHTDYKK